jgi:hypothetical protein
LRDVSKTSVLTHLSRRSSLPKVKTAAVVVAVVVAAASTMEVMAVAAVMPTATVTAVAVTTTVQETHPLCAMMDQMTTTTTAAMTLVHLALTLGTIAATTNTVHLLAVETLETPMISATPVTLTRVMTPTPTVMTVLTTKDQMIGQRAAAV